MPKSTARFNNVFKINGKSKREAGNKLGVFCLHTAFFDIHIIRFQAPVEVVRQGPVETAAVIKQRSKFAEQFAAIAEEHARSDFSREKFGLKKSLEKFGKNLD